jgi:hypothetical protein
MGDMIWPVPVAYTLHVFYLEHFVRVHGTFAGPHPFRVLVQTLEKPGALP